ncbi:MAG: caspase family protein [Candidatus Lokiarchaeota archaeon]|nr:caspase family protein [Candidatus Lokiarchaeota archaeon]
MKFVRKKKAKLALLSLFLGLSIMCGTVRSIVASSPETTVIDEQSNVIEEQPVDIDISQVPNPWNLDPWDLLIIYSNPWADFDGDMAVNCLEVLYGTNPVDRDSDGDGMWDGYEIYAWKQGGWQNPVVYNERYAVLLAGGLNNKPEFWNEMVRMYDTLVKGYNYKPENIWVLYADGNPPNEDNFDPISNWDLSWILKDSVETHGEMIKTMRPATPLSVFLSLTDLSNRLTSDDSLFFWVHNHGEGEPTAPNASIYLWGEDAFLTDAELTSYFLNAEFAQATFVLGQCFSGGFLDPSLLRGGVDPLRVHPDDSDDYLNLNDLAPDGTKNVIVMTSQDWCETECDYDTKDFFIYPFRNMITPYWYVNWLDEFKLYPNEWLKGEWILGVYEISYEYLMTFRAEYYHRIDPDGVVSMLEAFFGVWLQHYNAENYQYWESVPGLGARTYL